MECSKSVIEFTNILPEQNTLKIRSRALRVMWNFACFCTIIVSRVSHELFIIDYDAGDSWPTSKEVQMNIGSKLWLVRANSDVENPEKARLKTILEEIWMFLFIVLRKV